MGSGRFVRVAFIWVILGIGFFKMPLAVAQQSIFTTVCAVMRTPDAFAGRMVKVRATVQSGFESSTIVDANEPSCDSPWFDYAPKKESTVQPRSYDAEPLGLHPVFLLEDENMKRFDDALSAVVYPRSNGTLFIGGNPKRFNVTATMTGRVDDAGEGGSGFGHLNGWRVRFVLSSVENVATEERSYNWAEFSPDPVRFPHGTIRGKLTDAEGKPIKSAWVGAIPAAGKVPISYPAVLTKEDGSYSLDVEPGKYLVVVNRNDPAREDVPVLTTYFPSTEIEAGATPLNVLDHAELTAIDIQIHRILPPHFFEVQVLDRWSFGGDQHAVDKSGKRGYEVFRRVDKGNCASCHAIAEHTALFTDNEFHNIGVGVRNGAPTDLGRYEVTHTDRDRGAFKTPSLRNIAETAPYMHDGRLDTLLQVIDFYEAGGNANPWLDSKIGMLHLTRREKADLVAFLNSLSGEVPSEALQTKS